MRERIVSGAITGLAAFAAAACLWLWLRSSRGDDLSLRVEGMDGSGRLSAGASRKGTPLDLKGTFRKFAGVPSALPGSWPRFRGAGFDNVSYETVRLADAWDAKGPPVLWSLDLGEGHAGAAVHRGRVYVLDYDEKERADALRCFSLADGAEIWRRSYQVQVKRNHGMSRTVPAVSDRYVVSMGPKCDVLCVDAETGDFRWGLDLVAEFGAEVPLWYTGQCPLIDGETAVLAPAGKALMIGVDCGTGKVLWQTPNPHGWQMSHSSIMPMTIGGRRVYTYCAIGGIVAVAADGENRGVVLWESSEWNKAVVSPSPVSVGGDRIFVTAGYGAGSMMLQVREENGAPAVHPLYRLEKSVFACEQQTPILYEGNLLTILPKDAGALNGEMAWMSLDGKLLWTSGKTARFGLGPYLIADGKIFVLNDDGVLTLFRASAERCERLAQARVLDGRDAWGPMAMAGGRLLLRDSKRMVCLDVRAKE